MTDFLKGTLTLTLLMLVLSPVRDLSGHHPIRSVSSPGGASDHSVPATPPLKAETGNGVLAPDSDSDDAPLLVGTGAVPRSDASHHANKTLLLAGVLSAWPHGTIDPNRDAARAPPLC